MPSTAATSNPRDPSERRTPLRFRRRAISTTEREHGFGRLSFPRVAEGVVADRSDALGQRPRMTLGLDLQQAGNLHCGTEEDGVQHLFQRSAGETAVPRAERSPNPRS